MDGKYSRAYTEVLEIISHFSKDEYSKIPKEKIDFYTENMDKNYIFKINLEQDLSEQKISKEACAILVTIFRDYFATEQQKNTLNNLLNQSQIKSEELKKEIYSTQIIFKNKQKVVPEEKEETSIVEYKETFFTKFKKFIMHILNIH